MAMGWLSILQDAADFRESRHMSLSDEYVGEFVELSKEYEPQLHHLSSAICVNMNRGRPIS